MVAREKVKSYVAAYRAVWAAQPVPDTPAFGIDGCHALAAEASLTEPVPPVSAARCVLVPCLEPLAAP